MSRRFLGSVAGALALAAAALAVPSAAGAAKPAKVSVRVEAPDRTIVATTLTTTRAKVVKDGANACSGTTAAGALEQATNGRWTASWFDGLGYAVDAVDGVAPAGPNDFWVVWVNGKMSMTGLCGTELQRGDELLLYPCVSGPDFACTNRPLALVPPRGAVRPGKAVAVAVVTLGDDGARTPAPGATVRGGVAPVKADAKGVARVVLRRGASALRATQAGNVASAPISCVVGARTGTCGSRDRTPPQVTVKGIRAGQVFAARTAPRTLRGTARDPQGATVELRLVRTVRGTCTWFDARREAFRRCGSSRAPLFAAGDRARWSFLLPRKLAPGRYALDVRATDGAGNSAVKRVRFEVKSAR